MLHGTSASISCVALSPLAAFLSLLRAPRWRVLVLCSTPLLLTHAVRPSEQSSESTQFVQLNPQGNQARLKTVPAKAGTSQPKKGNRSVHRSNLCKRLLEVDAQRRPLVEALNGAHLTCAYTPGKCYMKRDANGEWSGYDYELLKTVSDYGKFTFDIELRELEQSTEFARQEHAYEELIQEYDIVLDHMTEKGSRDNRRLFPVFDHLDASLVLVTNREESDDTFQAVLHKVFLVSKPYDGWVWLLFLISCLITGVLYSFLETPSAEVGKLAPDDERTKVNSMYTGVLHLTTHLSFAPRTWPGRILVLSWTTISVVFLAGYTANLATILVMERESTREWNDIADAMKANARICVSAGTHAQKFMNSRYPGYANMAAVSGYSLKGMAAGECDAAIIWQMNYEVAVLQEEYNPKCRLYKVGDRLTTRFGGWTAFVDYNHRCTVLVRDAIHTIFQELEEDGRLANLYTQRLLHDETTLKKPCGADNKDASVSLGIENMGGLFLFHLLGAILAIVAFLVFGRGIVDEGSS